MALTVVQRAPRVRGTATTAVAITLPTPPTVGNAVVVPVIIYNASGLITTATLAATDNRGHAYTIAAVQVSGLIGCGILVCSKVVTSAAPFTITVTQTTSSYFEVSAMEVGGALGTGLIVDRSVVNFAVTATPTVGPTAAVTRDDVLVVAAFAIAANQGSITVESVSPSWTQDLENLDYSASVAGEADSRVRSGVLGTTQSCSWTATASTGSASCLAVFAANAPVTSVGTASFAFTGSGVGAFTAAVSGVGSGSVAFAATAPATALVGAVGSAAFAFGASGSSPVIVLATVDVGATVVMAVDRVLTVVPVVDRVLTI